MTPLLAAALSLTTFGTTAERSRYQEAVATVHATAERIRHPGTDVKMPSTFWLKFDTPNRGGHSVPEDILRMDRGVEKLLVENIERCHRLLPFCKALNRPDLVAKCEATLAGFESTLAELRKQRVTKNRDKIDQR